MTWCLTTPSHYLNQCWPIFNGFLLPSMKANFTGSSQDINASIGFEKYICIITSTSLRDKWNAVNSTVHGEFPAQRPVTRSFYVFLDLRSNKRLSKQWWVLWFETPSCPLWRHCNVMFLFGWQWGALKRSESSLTWWSISVWTSTGA